MELLNTIRTSRLGPYVFGILASLLILVLFAIVLGSAPKNEKQVRSSVSSAQGISQGQSTFRSEAHPIPSDLEYEASLGNGQLTSDFARLAALRKQLLSADEAQIVDLLVESNNIDSLYRRDATQFQIFRALSLRNPIGALAHAAEFPWGQQKRFIRAVFCEWSLNDLPTSVEYAQELGDLERQMAAIAILDARDDLSFDEQLNIATDLGFPDIAAVKREKLIVAASESDPESAWYSIIGDSTSDTDQVSTLVSIAEVWIQSAGPEILDQALESHLGEELQQEFLVELLGRIAEYHPMQAFQVAKDLYIESKNQAYLTAVVSSWALNDPSAALEAVARLSPRSFRKSLQETIVWTWITADPTDVLESISTIPREFRSAARESAIRYLSTFFPEQAAQNIASVRDKESKGSLAVAIANEWAENDVYDALNWILTDAQVSDMRDNLLYNIVDELTAEDPDLAMQTALDQPLSSSGFHLEAYVVARVARSNVDQAVEMLASVREMSKPFALSRVGYVLLRNQDSQRAIELGKKLTDTAQLVYYEYLLRDWVSEDFMGLFDSIDTLPTAKAQSIAAKLLESSNQKTKVLTEDQLDYVRSLQQEHNPLGS